MKRTTRPASRKGSQKYIPDYGTPELVLKAVDQSRLVERWRASNRAMIDNLFNGRRPYTDEEVQKFQIQVNTNFGEGSKIVMAANQQINSALLHKGNFFTATCLGGPVEKRQEYSQKFTANINRILKKNKRLMFTIKSRNASLTLHGVGPLIWLNDSDWLPRFLPMEDLLIPTNTTLDFANLTHFGVHLYYTPYELMEMALGDTTQEGWNQDMIYEILSAYKDISTNPETYNWWDQPEKMMQVWKQNRAFYDTDSVPKVKLLAFFYKSPEAQKDGEQQWFRKIVLREVPALADSSTQLANVTDFVYDGGDRIFSNSVDKILHVQFGDYNLVPPLTYQSVRGLGESLYPIVELQNRIRSQTAQHVLEQLMMYLRIKSPIDNNRPNLFELFQYAVLQEGVEIVPQSERHQVDAGMVETQLSENRQLMSESSSSYVQDIDNGTNKEMTAQEAQIRLQSVNKMVSGTLDTVYLLEDSFSLELTRRFLIKTSESPEVKAFWAACKRDGIPDALMVLDNWDIATDRVAGGGDQTLALQEVTALLGQSQKYDPTSQREILRDWTAVITRDWAKAQQLVPDKPNQATAGTMEAENVFGTLMDGIQIVPREGLERTDYVSRLLQMVQQKIQIIQQLDNMGTADELIGLQTVMAHIQANLTILEQDPNQKENVKVFSDALGKMQNEVKGFSQRLMESQKSKVPSETLSAKFTDLSEFPQAQEALVEQWGLPANRVPEANPKIVKVQHGIQAKDMQFAADQRRKQMQFALEQARENIRTVADISKDDALHRQELAQNAITHVFDLLKADSEASSQPEPATNGVAK